MKWFEIFGKRAPREDSFPDLGVEVPKNENAPELPPFAAKSEREIARRERELIVPKSPILPLPNGYFYPDATEAARLHAELLSALTDAHSLFSVPLETFAAREDKGAVLFRFRGNPSRFVLVHLSRIDRTEIDKDHPSIEMSGTFDDFLAHAAEVERTLSEQ